MSATQRTDYASLETTLVELDKGFTSVDTIGTTINSLMANLAGFWLGSASNAYQNAYQSWKQGYDESVGALARLRDETGTALATQVDDENVRAQLNAGV